jgi:hypothetical protein
VVKDARWLLADCAARACGGPPPGRPFWYSLPVEAARVHARRDFGARNRDWRGIAVFGLANTLLLKPLPVADPATVIRVFAMSELFPHPEIPAHEFYNHTPPLLCNLVRGYRPGGRMPTPEVS